VEPISKHTGIVVPLDRVNVDTDQVIPKQFLKLLTRHVTAISCFNDWRYRRVTRPTPILFSMRRATRAVRSCWRAPTSAAGPAANTPRGRYWTTAPRADCASFGDIFFYQFRSRMGCC